MKKLLFTIALLALGGESFAHGKGTTRSIRRAYENYHKESEASANKKRIHHKNKNRPVNKK